MTNSQSESGTSVRPRLPPLRQALGLDMPSPSGPLLPSSTFQAEAGPSKLPHISSIVSTTPTFTSSPSPAYRDSPFSSEDNLHTTTTARSSYSNPASHLTQLAPFERYERDNGAQPRRQRERYAPDRLTPDPPNLRNMPAEVTADLTYSPTRISDSSTHRPVSRPDYSDVRQTPSLVESQDYSITNPSKYSFAGQQQSPYHPWHPYRRPPSTSKDDLSDQASLTSVLNSPTTDPVVPPTCSASTFSSPPVATGQSTASSEHPQSTQQSQFRSHSELPSETAEMDKVLWDGLRPDGARIGSDSERPSFLRRVPAKRSLDLAAEDVSTAASSSNNVTHSARSPKDKIPFNDSLQKDSGYERQYRTNGDALSSTLSERDMTEDERLDFQSAALNLASIARSHVTNQSPQSSSENPSLTYPGTFSDFASSSGDISPSTHPSIVPSVHSAPKSTISSLSPSTTPLISALAAVGFPTSAYPSATTKSAPASVLQAPPNNLSGTSATGSDETTASEVQEQYMGNGAGKYACNICQKRFTRPSALAVHTHMHTGEKPFSCSVCKRSFSVNSNLRRHLRTHTKAEKGLA